MQGYRTLIFNALMAVVAIVRIVSPTAVLPADEELAKIFDAVWGVVLLVGNVFYRFKTSGPVGVRDPECK